MCSLCRFLIALLAAAMATAACGDRDTARGTHQPAAPTDEAEPTSAPEAAEPGAGNITTSEFDIADPASGGRGGELYLNHCASCHDSGLNHAPQRAALALMSPQSVYQVLDTGVMIEQAIGLSDADKLALAEFLTKRKMDSITEVFEPPACEGDSAEFDFSAPPAFSGWGITPENTGFIPTELAGIGRDDIGRLKLRWAVGFPNAIRMRSQPGLGGGALYVGSHNGSVYALDQASGCMRWAFQAGSEVRTGIVVAPWEAGDVNARPLLHFGDLVGNVYAVDARDGSLVWRKRADPHPNATITATPTLFEGRLYVGVSSMEIIRPANPQYACCTFRGSVIAYDAVSGEVLWKTFTIADEPSRTGTNARGTPQFAPSGAAVWNSPTIDAQRRRLYIGTGGNYSAPATDTSDAVLAMDLETGEIEWVYQGRAGDVWNNACIAADQANCPPEPGPDFDFGASMILAHARDGEDVVLAGQKSGWLHALDPDTGALRWRVKPARGGILGGIHFGMAAGAGRIYVPVNDAPDGQDYGEPARPGVYALDIDGGASIWAAPSPTDTCGDLPLCLPGYTQAITATPELVFAGNADGWFRIFDAETGALLWEFDTKPALDTVNGHAASGGSMGGGAAPVAYDGTLYVSAGYGLGGLMPGNLLLAFATSQ